MFEFSSLKKNLKKDFSRFPKVKVSVLGDSATQLLVTALRGQAYESQLNLDIFEADYDQIPLQLNNPLLFQEDNSMFFQYEL